LTSGALASVPDFAPSASDQQPDKAP
jgi:hypothetical protein